MKIVAASTAVMNGKTDANFNKMKAAIEENQDADLIFFGETCLQGFDALTWNYEQDCHIAIGLDDTYIKEFQFLAKEYHVALSFGFIEKDCDKIYSSQLCIDDTGKIVDVFHRVSQGWRKKNVDSRYQEGSGFHRFSLKGKTFSVGLCGDLWFDENVKTIKEVNYPPINWQACRSRLNQHKVCY